MTHSAAGGSPSAAALTPEALFFKCLLDGGVHGGAKRTGSIHRPDGRVIGSAGEKDVGIIVRLGANKIASAYPAQLGVS